MFTVEERDRVRGRLLEVASADARVVAAAEVGSAALGGGDRWSDLDLTFGVAKDVVPADVLGDFTQVMARELGAAELFDLPHGSSIYRVFLLPSCLQVDLSFTSAPEFGAHSPRFKLLFGEAVEKDHLPQPDARELFGLGVHDAVRARFCVERGKPWQAVYLIGQVRDCAFALACLRRGLAARYSRGADELPRGVLSAFEETLVQELGREGLIAALRRVVALLQREAVDVGDVVAQVEPQLREITTP